MDQGLNLKVPLPGGKSFGLSGGLFNRMQASVTKFMQLPFTPKLSMDDVWVKRKAPNTLVLHARAGNCIGDMASYDYFTLGGPYSVRGYTYGELGAARRFVETAAEVGGGSRGALGRWLQMVFEGELSPCHLTQPGPRLVLLTASIPAPVCSCARCHTNSHPPPAARSISLQ